MYSPYRLARKYISYYLNASNGKGHGVHSPFVFDFITHVLNDKSKPPASDLIESYRDELLHDEQIIEVEDFGAGSVSGNQKKKKIKDIAAHSLKRPKYAGLLYRIAAYYKCKNVLELGTSLGTTTAYLASASSEIKVVTMEGASAIASIAQRFFQKGNFTNIQLITGDFKYTLPEFLGKGEAIDLAFIDGNHRKEPTIQYFESILENTTSESILIFDDIHWGAEMEEAWAYIQSHEQVTLSMDLFFVGIVFFRKEFLVRRSFSIRF